MLRTSHFFPKQSALTIVCALAVTGAALAQGTLNWNTFGLGFSAQTNATQFSPVFGGWPSGSGTIGNTAQAISGLTYYYELLYNTSFTGSQAPNPYYDTLFGGTWLDTGLTATNANLPGTARAVNPSATAAVPWADGVTNNIMMVGWSANLGTSWTVVSNLLANWPVEFSTVQGLAFFGESATGYLTPNPASADSGALVFAGGATTNGLPIFSPNTQLYLLPTPEPCTIVLAGLGGLSVWLFRRRK